MCTLSWIQTESSYQVFFNRDEKRSRPQALPPQPLLHHDVNVLMPLDPEGGGSWISVNEYGLSLYLLNCYQGSMPSGTLISRGQLLRSLCHLRDLSSVKDQLFTTDITQYAPFTLVAFELSSTKNTQLMGNQVYQWDGDSIDVFRPKKFITSSSVKFDEVSTCRQKYYAQITASDTPEEHIAFHASHDGDKNYRSVCMHREDAKTVSFSNILVTNNNITFEYHDGSPCDTNSPTITKVLERQYNYPER